jgi:hypothetical protein
MHTACTTAGSRPARSAPVRPSPPLRLPVKPLALSSRFKPGLFRRQDNSTATVAAITLALGISNFSLAGLFCTHQVSVLGRCAGAAGSASRGARSPKHAPIPADSVHELNRVTAT